MASKKINPKELYKVPEVQELASTIMRLSQQAKLWACLIDAKGNAKSQHTAIVEALEACGFVAEFVEVKEKRKKGTNLVLWIGIPNPKVPGKQSSPPATPGGKKKDG